MTAGPWAGVPSVKGGLDVLGPLQLSEGHCTSQGTWACAPVGTVVVAVGGVPQAVVSRNEPQIMKTNRGESQGPEAGLVCSYRAAGPAPLARCLDSSAISYAGCVIMLSAEEHISVRCCRCSGSGPNASGFCQRSCVTTRRRPPPCPSSSGNFVTILWSL